METIIRRPSMQWIGIAFPSSIDLIVNVFVVQRSLSAHHCYFCNCGLPVGLTHLTIVLFYSTSACNDVFCYITASDLMFIVGRTVICKL